MAAAKPLKVGDRIIATDGTRFVVVAIYPEARNRASNVLVRGEVSGAELEITYAKASSMERL